MKAGDHLKERLHPFQLSILLYSIQNGLVVYTLPRVTAQYFGTNGWLSIIFIFILVNINILLIATIYKLGKGRSIFEIIEATIPKWVMIPIYLFIICVWIGLASMIMREYIFIMKIFFYPALPAVYFVIFFTLLGFQLLTGGIHHITKAFVVLICFVMPMLALLLYLISEFEFDRFTSFYFKGGTDYFEGSLRVYSAYLGIEVSMLLFPVVDKKWTKSLFIGNFFSLFIYLIVTFMCFGFFSFDQVLNDLYPIMTLFEYTEVSFLSRAENLCFCVFAFKILATTVIYYWGAQKTLENIAGKVKPGLWIILILATGFVLALIPGSVAHVEKWSNWLSNCAILIAWALPIFVLGVLFIQMLRNQMLRETDYAK
ncbi:spore germination protein (amino acid permease) [Paenibacillus taihuensis]|uniref:Spore germination protein (Amino acid permease) n=1 Tax=Paenibacillus taihuensis TaxID=1156355 RepID=A0A3D9QWD0_9BACL|nr:GerAB/ArcD/ProY family transporter [Paenibacillus taihuensis]REE69707.1 spore germination protein (amino acid permease) [Paenibacillus taihuensis]